MAAIKLRQMECQQAFHDWTIERLKGVWMQGTIWNSSKILMYQKTIRKDV